MSARATPLRLRILVVDDHLATATMLEEYLSTLGATVFTAGTAQQAFSLVDAQRPDVVLTDLQMPREDGLWLLHEIRALPQPLGVIPVYAITGHRYDSEAIKKFSGYFLKPLDPDAVATALRQLPRDS